MCAIWCHHYAQDEYEVSTSDCGMCTLMDDKDSFNYNWDKTNSFLKWSSLWEGEGAKLLPCYTDMFPFLNEHGSRQVIQKCLCSRGDSDISSIWERKQIGIIKVQCAPCKFISLLFLLQHA